MPGKDGQFPLPDVFVPPSPFRPINLLERLNQLSDPPFNPSSSLRTPTLGDLPEILEPHIISPRGFILPESCSPSVISVSSKSASHEDLASADTIFSSSTQCTVDDPPSRPSQHVCEPANTANNARIDPSSQPVAGQLTTMNNSLDSEVLNSSPTHVIDSSLNPVVPPASDDRPRGPPPCSGQWNCRKSSPPPPTAKTISSPPLNGTGNASPVTETMVLGGQDSYGKETLSTDNNDVSALREEPESGATSTNGDNSNSHQRLDSLSPRSTNVLAGLCLPLESTSSIEQTNLLADSIPIQHPPTATPSRTAKPSVAHPDFSRSTVQRPVIVPTTVRANNGTRKLNSPTKFPFEAGDVYRTPAQRVPIETALARGTSSFQRTVQTSNESDQSQLGRFLTIRAPVFTRPALDDPSRSPAKRIPVADLVASPTRGGQAPDSPTRLSTRARSTSVEPRPLRPILARSRSIEPCAVNSKHDHIKESIFPMVPMLPRSGTKLPFPLISSQRSRSHLPPPIPEEHKTAEIGNTETTQGNTMSQLRQPSTNSRIPRIGSKPYARPPPKNGKATSADTARAPVSSSFTALDSCPVMFVSRRLHHFGLPGTTGSGKATWKCLPPNLRTINIWWGHSNENGVQR